MPDGLIVQLGEPAAHLREKTIAVRHLVVARVAHIPTAVDILNPIHVFAGGIN